MKLLVVCALACVPLRAAAGSCQDTVEKGGEYVFSHEEAIEGGKRCYVKHKDGGDPIFHTIVWNDAPPPPAKDDKKDHKQSGAPPPPAPPPEGPCEKEVTPARLGEMWKVIATARKNSKSTVPGG